MKPTDDELRAAVLTIAQWTARKGGVVSNFDSIAPRDGTRTRFRVVCVIGDAHSATLGELVDQTWPTEIYNRPEGQA